MKPLGPAFLPSSSTSTWLLLTRAQRSGDTSTASSPSISIVAKIIQTSLWTSLCTMPTREKHLTRRQRQDQQAARAASAKKATHPPRHTTAVASSSVSDYNVHASSGSLTSRDHSHMASIQTALAVVADVGPLVHMQRVLPPGSSFTMEKSVFDVPMADVKRALAYYDELELARGMGGGLTKGQEEIVKAGKRARGELKRLIDMRDGRRGITVVDV